MEIDVSFDGGFYVFTIGSEKYYQVAKDFNQAIDYVIDMIKQGMLKSVDDKIRKGVD